MKVFRRKEKRGRLIGRVSTTGSFFSGLAMGLGAATIVHSMPLTPPKYRGEGIGGDWRAIGADVRAAMRQFDEQDA